MIERLKIKEAIKEYRLTVNELSVRLWISRVGLSQHINGSSSTEVLLRIADAIGRDISDLFDRPTQDSVQITCPNCGKPITIKAEGV